MTRLYIRYWDVRNSVVGLQPVRQAQLVGTGWLRHSFSVPRAMAASFSRSTFKGTSKKIEKS